MKTLQHFSILIRKSLICSLVLFTFSAVAYAQNPNSNPNAQAPWKLNGSQADTTQFVGTINNVDLVFKRNNIEGLRLLEDTSTRFMGNVFLDRFKENPPINSGPPKEVFLKVDNQGKIISTDKSGLLESIYTSPSTCLSTGINVGLPIWSATSTSAYGILYTGIDCPARVGIGTNNPATSLHVVGNGSFQGNLGVGVVPTTINTVSIFNPVNRTGIELSNNHPTSISLKYGIKNIVNNPNTIAYSVTDQTTNQDVFVVKGDGSVGIGTDNPEDELQVRSGPTKLVIGSAAGEPLGWGTSYIGFNASRQNGSTWQTADDSQHNGGSVIYGDIFGSIIFSTIPTEPSTVSGGQSNIPDATIKTNTRLFIHRNGNVGIGTTAVNGAKLSVEGNIRARRIQVDNPNIGWSDFVFDANYSLLSLEEVESFIANNHHLPDVPSANEVKENGIDLAQMDAILLQKIEELTLYLLQLKKENDILKEKIILLETK